MIKLILLAVLAVFAVVLVLALRRPDTFRIQRSITLQAPPERVFAHLDNFHAWEAWSPWEKIDPNIVRTYSGATQGPGAVYEWRGNKDIGHGRMAIVTSQAAHLLVLEVHFITPFEARNTITFTLEPQADATVLTQAMHGPSPFISKVMGLFFNMDKMVGDKYEEGLGTLKTLVEQKG